MLIVHGTYEGISFTLAWKDGAVSGDDWMVDLLHLMTRGLQVNVANYLKAFEDEIYKNPWTFHQAVYLIADDVTVMFSDEPEIPSVPKGCVA